VVVATLFIAAGYASAFAGPAGARAGAWCMALGNAGLAAATMALGAGGRAGVSRSLRWILAGTFLVIFAGFAAALALPAAEYAGAPLLLGLPRRAAFVIYGVGILPLLILPVTYAVTFDESRLDPERVRRRVAELTGQGGGHRDVEREPPAIPPR
jgi:hypothetical protein